MRTTTFICDVCKKSVGETELLKVSASVTVPRQVSYSGKKSFSAQKLLSCDKDICKDCMSAKGLIVLSKEGEDQEEIGNQKTFEAKLIDFLEELGVAFVE